jgi:hypothetical protein
LSGRATKPDLGSGAATDIHVIVANMLTGKLVLDASYTTDISAVSPDFAFKAECNNGAVASAHNLELTKIYRESDC